MWAALTTTYTQHPHSPWYNIGKQLSAPHVNKGFPTLWADITTTYPHNPHPPCHNIGKQLSAPHIYKGFPYMDDHTKPLCGQTKPLRTRNTHTHRGTILENNCQGPMFIRVSPIWMKAQNHFVGRHNRNLHATLTPTVPYMDDHTKPLCGQT